MLALSETSPSINELTTRAEEAEKSDTSAAIELYNEILKENPLQIHAYDRLMILYRQEKDYKKELSIIHRGIKTYEKFYKEQLGKPGKKMVGK